MGVVMKLYKMIATIEFPMDMFAESKDIAMKMAVASDPDILLEAFERHFENMNFIDIPWSIVGETDIPE